MSQGLEAVLSGEAIPLRPVAENPLGILAGRVLDGDREAFGELLARTEPRILGLAWRILGDRDLARDAAQEAYLRAFRSLGTYRRSDPFEPWLVRITVNACYDLARKRGPFRWLLTSWRRSCSRMAPILQRRPSSSASVEPLFARPWQSCPQASGPPSCCGIWRASPRKKQLESWACARSRYAPRPPRPGPSSPRPVRAS